MRHPLDWLLRLVEVTGPERTLVEGFRRPGLVGGLEELKVVRLGELAAEIGRHPFLGDVLALKGGTALNLAFGAPSRMSVDLDFNYVGQIDREKMLADRPRVETIVADLARRTEMEECFRIEPPAQAASPG